MRSLQAIAFLALLVVAAYAQTRTTGFQTVVGELKQFQAKSGGFETAPGSGATLQATSQALFLSSIFGLRDRIDAAAVIKFVESMKQDQGFSNIAGGSSDLQSVRNALLCYGYLGVATADKNALEGYIRSLYDSESRLFSNKVGGPASLKATAEALESLSLLSALNRDSVSKIVSEVKSHLTESIKEVDGTKSFVFSSVSGDKEIYESNVYAIIAASYAGVKFGNAQPFAEFFSTRQASNGGISTVFGSRPSLEATFQAVAALSALERSTGFDLGSGIAQDQLLGFVYNIGHDLTASFMAHYVVAHTTSFKKIFSTELYYETATGPIDATTDVIVQGTVISPAVRALPFNQPHAGLNVEAVLSHASGADRKIKLQWNPERVAYTTDESFDTNGKLGELSVTVNVGIQVVGETVGFALHESKKIGYNMRLKPSAKVAGKDVKVGDYVTVGTEFSFEVELATQQPVTQGNFELIFSVMDSSDVVISQTVKDCSKASGPLSFNYELNHAGLPSGALSFRFQVKDTASGIIHTQQRIAYVLSLPMVASQITFEKATSTKPTYQLGQTAVVTMVPASFPNMVDIHTYSSKDDTGADVSGSRIFYLDCFSAGRLLHSFPGVASANSQGALQLRFEVVFPATFDTIGSHDVRFRYVPRYGKDIQLDNFDSARNEKFDDLTPVGFNVEADLELSEINNAPKGGSLFYGNEISFTFQITDKLSGKAVHSPAGSDSVFLTLSHVDAQGKTYVSARDVARPATEGFAVDWIVNPNAVKGKGKLQLVAEVIGDEQIVLKTANGKTFSVDVDIGGDISHKAVIKQAWTPEASHGAAVVELTLSCQGKPLTGAQLVASVTNSAGKVMTIPVGRNDEESKYSVSWALTEENATSGEYQVAVFREVDAQRASSQPLFTVPVSFVGATVNYLPFRTEAVVLTLVLGGFVFFSYRKWLVEAK